MYAHIRIIKGANKNKEEIISTKDLVNFKSNLHHSNIKYVKHSSNGNQTDEAVCIILNLSETKKNLSITNKSKRTRMPSTKYLVTASSASSADENSKPSNKKKKDVKSSSLKKEPLSVVVQNKIEQFNNIPMLTKPQAKNEQEFAHATSQLNLPSIISSKSDCSTTKVTIKAHAKTKLDFARTSSQLNSTSLVSSKSDCSTIKVAKTHAKTKQNFDLTSSQLDPSSIVPSKSDCSTTKLSKIYVNTKQDFNRTSSQLDPLSPVPNKYVSSTTKLVKRITNTVNNDVSSIIDEPPTKKNKIDDLIENEKNNVTPNKVTAAKQGPKVKSCLEVHPIKDCAKSVQKLNSKIATLETEIKQLQKEKATYKNKYLNSELELKAVSKLNQDLQTHLIERVKEREEMMQSINTKGVGNATRISQNYPPIGTLRTTDNSRRYHIGRDIWLGEIQYNGLLNSSKSPSVLAGNLITLIFEIKELEHGTISGYRSRRTSGGKVPCDRLDPIRLGACEDFYIYWLDYIYIPESEEAEKKICTEIKRFYYHARNKIAELKRLPQDTKIRKAKNKRKKRSISSEENSITEADKRETEQQDEEGRIVGSRQDGTDNEADSDGLNTNQNEDTDEISTDADEKEETDADEKEETDADEKEESDAAEKEETDADEKATDGDEKEETNADESEETDADEKATDADEKEETEEDEIGKTDAGEENPLFTDS